MKCHLKDRDRKMDDYLLKKLSDEETEDFEKHVFSCPECLDELRMREQMVALMKEQPPASGAVQTARKPRLEENQIATRHRRRPWRTKWIYVGVAATIILVSIFLLRWPREDVGDSNLASFEESAYLESILTQTFQSSDISIAVVSPQIGENFTGEILFRWRAEKNGQDFSGPLQLKILDNKENVVHSESIDGNRFRLRKTLDPGLYYWTFEDNGQMLHLGKFFVHTPNQ